MVILLNVDNGHWWTYWYGVNDVGDVYQYGCVVVVVLGCDVNNHVDFLLGTLDLWREDILDVLILHLLKDAVGAEHEVVAGPYVVRVVDVGSGAALHVRLHGAGDDVLLVRVLCLFGGELSKLDKVVHQRVVVCLEQDFGVVGVLARAYVIYAAVAHVGDCCTFIMQFQECHCCAHLLGCAVVFGVEHVKGVT